MRTRIFIGACVWCVFFHLCSCFLGMHTKHMLDTQRMRASKTAEEKEYLKLAQGLVAAVQFHGSGQGLGLMLTQKDLGFVFRF